MSKLFVPSLQPQIIKKLAARSASLRNVSLGQFPFEDLSVRRFLRDFPLGIWKNSFRENLQEVPRAAIPYGRLA